MIGKTELESLTQKSALSRRLTRGLQMAGFLSKSELESLLAGAVRTTVIDGVTAGDHAVSGLEVGDALRSVLKLDFTLVAGLSRRSGFSPCCLERERRCQTG